MDLPNPRPASPLLRRVAWRWTWRSADRFEVLPSECVPIAPSAGARPVDLCAEDPAAGARPLELRLAETGTNFFMLRPFDPVGVERVEHCGGTAYARVTEILLELMTEPGRGPAVAKAILAWMKDNEGAWKLNLTNPA